MPATTSSRTRRGVPEIAKLLQEPDIGLIDPDLKPKQAERQAYHLLDRTIIPGIRKLPGKGWIACDDLVRDGFRAWMARQDEGQSPSEKEK